MKLVDKNLMRQIAFKRASDDWKKERRVLSTNHGTQFVYPFTCLECGQHFTKEGTAIMSIKPKKCDACGSDSFRKGDWQKRASEFGSDD